MSALRDFPYAGAWALKQFCIRFSDQRPIVYPFGKQAKGMIIYTPPLNTEAAGHPTGRVSAVLMGEERPVASGGRLEDSSKATDAYKAAAFDTYLHYAGRYHWHGDHIVHHIDMALDPAVIGTQQVRATHFDPERGELMLSYELTARSGIQRHYELVWQRVES